MATSPSPLRHLDLSDEKVAADLAAEKARELVNAYERIEELQQALRGMLRLAQIVAGRGDIPPGVRDALTISHQVTDAQELLLR